MGLANATGGTPFASGKDLKGPGPAASDPAGENSDALADRDPATMLRKFRTIYVQSRSAWIKADVVQAALAKQPEFAAWNLLVVNDPRMADLMLTVDRVLFTWDFTYELTHRKTTMVLDTGKLTAADGISAAPKIARKIMDRIKTVRPVPPAPAKSAG